MIIFVPLNQLFRVLWSLSLFVVDSWLAWLGGGEKRHVMKAIRVEKQGGPEVLKLLDIPPIETPGALPDEFTFEGGAAFPLQGMTAHYLSTNSGSLFPAVSC